MKKRTWIILGATSHIAEAFAQLAAEANYRLILVGRDALQLAILEADLTLRYPVSCEHLVVHENQPLTPLTQRLMHTKNADLFIAQGMMAPNDTLTHDTISELITVNITNIISVINAYWQKKQTAHHVIFLSSVAACKGRAKNSLYGASKAAVEVYLQGLQQRATPTQQITIARLGYIDTHLTYGVPGIFYAASPTSTAKACWRALEAKKRLIYYPFFWRSLMAVLCHLPFFIWKRLGTV